MRQVAGSECGELLPLTLAANADTIDVRQPLLRLLWSKPWNDLLSPSRQVLGSQEEMVTDLRPSSSGSGRSFLSSLAGRER